MPIEASPPNRITEADEAGFRKTDGYRRRGDLWREERIGGG